MHSIVILNSQLLITLMSFFMFIVKSSVRKLRKKEEKRKSNEESNDVKYVSLLLKLLTNSGITEFLQLVSADTELTLIMLF